MVYCLIDDWIYLDLDGKTGIYGPQEIERNLKSKIKIVTASFLDCQTKTVSLVGQQPTHQETLVNSAFTSDYIVAQERLSVDSLQVIGAPKDKVEEIYRYFGGIYIEKLVPYAVAIRAFLKSRNLLDLHPYVIFLDDLKNQAVLTFFEGMRFSASRRITMRDSGYMISEIKRSWQGFAADADASFVLISNNQEWLSAFVREGFLLKENMIHVESEFAVLEGLKNAKFTMHFSPAQEILRKKKHQIWKNRLKTFMASLLLISLGLASYGSAKIYKQKVFGQHQNLLVQENQYKSQLKDLYQQKFLTLLNRRRPIDYTKIYYDFVRSTPADYFVDSFQFQKDADDTWNFKGVIYPRDGSVTQAKFVRQLSFSNASVSAIVSHKVLGQQISLKIKAGQGGGIKRAKGREA